MQIYSKDNSLLRRARAVRDGKADDAIFIEGLRLCEEALSSDLKIEAAIYSQELAGKARAADLMKQLKSAATSAVVSEKLLASISYTKTPQGVVVLAERPSHDEESFAKHQPRTPFLVILHETNNPVNVGAIIRTAEAAGVTGIITTARTSDPFSPKSLRGAMGSAFRLPVWTGVKFDAVMAWCGAKNIRTICADATGGELYTDVDWSESIALLVGPESTGLSAAEIAAAGTAVRIPMQGRTESLNVAVATGIILYQAARQRMQK
ncbi:MAG TPA: RNA methyltransferase [Pyrinomonadaceae bacterium]